MQHIESSTCSCEHQCESLSFHMSNYMYMACAVLETLRLVATHTFSFIFP